MQLSVNKIYPWQESLWQRLTANAAGLSHGLLFAGPAGIGKRHFAEQFAARLLCENSEGDGANSAFQACGKCTSCHLLSTGNHPDFRLLTLAEDEDEDEEGGKSSASKKPSTQIKIDQVRALEDFVHVGSHRRGSRVVLIHPAEAMNLAAANSLLKMLEEPPPGVYFVLVSSNIRKLLPTMISRCRQVTFGLPEPKEAIDWLRAQGAKNAENLLPLVGGAPLAAAEWSAAGLDTHYRAATESFADTRTDVVSLAARWLASFTAKGGKGGWTPEYLTDALQKWLYDLQRVQLGQTPRYFTSEVAALRTQAKTAVPAKLARGYSDVSKIRASINHPLNAQLMLEDLAGRFLAAVAPSPQSSR